MADGATESSFADRWAQALSRRFVNAPPAPLPPGATDLAEWMQPLQKAWHAGIQWEALPWFAEEKARAGAFATLLGLKFERSDAERRGTLFFAKSLFGLASRRPMRWEGFAVGDSCVFHVRGDALRCAFPVERAADFDSRPYLLGSCASANEAVGGAIRHREGDYQPDDLFVLATDALAKWFLTRHEAGEKPWTTLEGLQTAGEFERFVTGLRQASEMRNDDVTLILIRWAGRTPRTPPPRKLVATGLPDPT